MSDDAEARMTCPLEVHLSRAIGRFAIILFLSGASQLLALPPDREISQYVRRNWTVEQGLPHGTVRSFAQTTDGYLWLATYEGLVRFNGERFRIFDQASGIPNDSILAICRTRDDTLWLGTAAGLLRYRNDRFEPVTLKGVLGDESVFALTEAPDGTLWVGTAVGLNRIVNGRPEKVTFPLRSNVINAIAVAGRNTLWIGTVGGGLSRVRNGKVDTYTTAEGLSSDTIVTLLPDGEEAMFVGTAAGLDKIENGEVRHVDGLPADQITALQRDRDRNLWIGTYTSGLFRFDGNRLFSYGISDGLLNPTVRAIFEDDEGSIWVGTNRGLEQLRVGAFITWGKSHGLGDDFTRAIFEDREGVLWVGTANGLSRFEGGRWRKVDDERLANAYVLAIAQSRDGSHWFGTSNGLFQVRNGTSRLFTVADGLSDDSIRVIHEDKRGDLWIATDYGLNRLRQNGTIESFVGRAGLGNEYVISIAETPDGRLWIATGAGLGEFDGSRFKLHSAPQGLPSNRLFALDADSDGTVWIATDGDGLVRFRDDGWKLITSSTGLASDKIVSLVDDGEGNLWFGTTARGVFKASKKDLHAIADGSDSKLDAQLYDENDGLGSRQCNGSGSPTAFRSRDGRIWFATADGVSTLTTGSSIQPKLPRRRPLVERVLVNGQPVAGYPRVIAPGTERIEFEFSGVTFVASDRMRFRYRLDGYDTDWVDAASNRVASYTNLAARTYRFVLASSRDGERWHATEIPFTLKPHFYETSWFIALCIIAGVAVLLALHFGRLHLSRERAHQLERIVDARTKEIVEEKERTEFALRAAEVARREAERHERLTEQALAEAEEANRAKSVFLATTSHELRTPLNAIIGFSDILVTNLAKNIDPRYARFLQNIHSSGQYLLGIINNILDLSKIEAGKMELQPETIALRETVNGIVAVMKGVTELKRIRIELEIPGDIPKFEADPTQLKQIIYNLMANAVKFSPEESTVTVAARHLWPVDSPIGENAVEIRVIDHGIGIDPKDHQLIFQEFRQAHGARGRPEGTGLGLTLVKRFVEMHRGAVRVESEPGQGSTFIVVLPCRYQPPMTDDAATQDAAAKG